MTGRKKIPMGSIVAFEGRPDLISTHLRLLPTSSQFLILPSIESYLNTKDRDQCFEPRTFIQRVHNALISRDEAARTFLAGATADHKRLVFVNGSTSGAQALCVKELMKYETLGDRAEAETMFDEIIKDVLEGLEKQRSTFAKPKAGVSQYPEEFKGNRICEEDPITRAMRAADALDRQTASLQPSSGLDLTFINRSRSSSLPLYDFSDEFQDSTPFYVFGVKSYDRNVNAQITTENLGDPLTPTFAIASRRLSVDASRLGAPVSPGRKNSLINCIGETYESPSAENQADVSNTTPLSEAFSLHSADHIVYGEASVLDMRQSLVRDSIPRIKSLDRIYPTSPKYRDPCIPSESWLLEPETPRVAQQLDSTVLTPNEGISKSNRLSIHVDRPRTILVNSRHPTIKIKPVPMDKKKRKCSKAQDMLKSKKYNYVDRGTDAGGLREEPVLQQVLPVKEDLVIFFKEELSDVLLESAISTFKKGRYPLLSHSPTTSEVEDPSKSLPSTPRQTPRQQFSQDGPQLLCVGTNGVRMTSPMDDDYDPFAYTQPTGQALKVSHYESAAPIAHPRALGQTTPPLLSSIETEYRVHELTITSSQTAVSVQNLLRSVLSEYFPPDTQCFHQFQFSLLPEFDELWKPMFRGRDPDNSLNNDGGDTQILAIGSQKGVRKEYSLAVTGRLEKVGRKSTEIVKTGRVDFRYLLANAMQAFTAQRLANQTSDNPFTNSYLLATLIVPHLETYLALHTDVRYLLLMYPPEHMATVLALQKLVGIDVLKVAQIVDSDSKENSRFTDHHGTQGASKGEEKSWTSSFSPRTSSDVSVSNANYLLTSTATEKDIATFVTAVWNIDIEEPDEAVTESLPTKTNRKKRPPPLNLKTKTKDTLSAFPRIDTGSPLSPKSKPLQPPAAPQEPSSPAMSVGKQSIAETMKTAKSAKSKYSLSKFRFQKAPQVESESVPEFDLEDSDDDVYERRLMPVFMQKATLRKPNSRKALKFLGLA